MGRRKKSTVPAENISADGCLKLDEISRLELLRLEAEIHAMKSKIDLKQFQLAAFLREIDPNGLIAKYQTENRAQIDSLEALQRRYTEKRAEIEEKLQISLKDYSFDDETGVLHRHPPGS